MQANRIATSLQSKGVFIWLIGRTKFQRIRKLSGDSFAEERNTKLYAATDADGRPIRFFVSAGQASDYCSKLAKIRYKRHNSIEIMFG